MITPRRTRLVRVPNLHSFRRATAALAAEALASGHNHAAVVVPTHGAARALVRTLTSGGQSRQPLLVTRDQLYDELHRRLIGAPRRLTAYERDAMAQAAAQEASAEAGTLPFKVRPGLVAELLRFYDQLRRQSQQVARFEELIVEAIGGAAGEDRGVDRLLQQTGFLASTFRGYERRVAASRACDEHSLRTLLMAQPADSGLRHAIVTVADWIADPTGLFVADFDLLARIPLLEKLDIVCTDAVLQSGFHERVHNWWPGLDEVDGRELAPSDAGRTPAPQPRIVCPPEDPERLWFTFRDREEELIDVAARLAVSRAEAPIENRAAIVFKRPLPYLYLAPDTLGPAGVLYQTFDALPLAAEPVASAIDLIFDVVESDFARGPLVALLGSPHLRLASDLQPFSPQSLGALNQFLSKTRYLGGLDGLNNRAKEDRGTAAGPLETAAAIAQELKGFTESAPASTQVRALREFLQRHWSPLEGWDREQKVRDTLATILEEMANAHAAHHNPSWTIDDLAWAVRRWIGDETFPLASATEGISLLDDQAARYGDFDDVTIVGLIENEWPDRPRRNIFYPPDLLKSLGWPSEKDRRGAADARFLDLIASASTRVTLSTFTLEDEAIVTRSMQLDEVPRAKLSTVPKAGISEVPQAQSGTLDGTPSWSSVRSERSSADAPEFHGAVGAVPPRPWSVSALETYLGCPFKFFAQHILKLDEEPDDEEVMDPRRQGQLVHEVFEKFFAEWQATGHREITAENLALARSLFVQVVDRALASLSEGEAALERTRLLGSSAAAGLGEAVFRMEAERPVPVVERLLEHSLSGRFEIATAGGSRLVELRGKADRVDLLADGTFRVIDYKLGWPPDRGRALQLPIYGICAEQRLNEQGGRRGQRWTLGEAVYLAFKGPKRVVPLFSSESARPGILANAQRRLSDTLDAIARGEFPPTPDDVFRCETCSFGAVCRKDYVGDI